MADFLRLTPCAGSGIVGTKATGLLTLRPDLVRVGSGVYDDEMSESSSLGVESSSLSARFRLPPLPPPRPRPRPRPLPEARAEDAPAGDVPTSALRPLGVPTRPPRPRRPLLAIGGGVGSLSLVT